MFKRPHFEPFKKRIQEKRKFIQVLMGPRQVGKTTLVSQLLDELEIPSLFVSADALGSGVVWLEQQWELARLRLQQTDAFLLVIDEIQKIPNWSEMVKALWDADTREKRNIKVVLLGSSRLLLQQGLTESLAGRFEVTYLGHWSYPEMRAAFGWEVNQFVWFGGYPGSAELISNEDRWKKYVSDSLIETSISKDILILTRVDKPALMRKLFELGCMYSGQILSFTKIMGQLQDAGNTTTLSHYLHLLDTAGLLGGLEKYAGDTIRQRGSSPKFQVHDTALMAAQTNERFAEVLARPDQWGRMVESAVGAHLLNGSLTDGYKLYYWRQGNNEVDFVIEHKGKVIGLEVKSGAKQRASGMEAFKKQCKPDKLLVIGHSGIPWQEFLGMNVLDLF